MLHWKIIYAKQGKEIRAFYDDETIRVYQTYNKVIAEAAINVGKEKLLIYLEKLCKC